MGSVVLAISVVCALAGALDGARAVREAWRAGDRDGLRQVARRVRAAGLAPLLGGGDRQLARAAVLAAEDAPDADALLPALRGLAAGADRGLAPHAARAAARIAGRLDAVAAADADLDDGWLALEGGAWRALAAHRGRLADVRVAALEVAARLDRARGVAEPVDALALLADPEPEVRRAALELMPAPLPAARVDAVAAALLAEPDDEVALAAAQALCAGASADARAAARRALGEPGLARLAALVADAAARSPARADAARCLDRAAKPKAR